MNFKKAIYLAFATSLLMILNIGNVPAQAVDKNDSVLIKQIADSILSQTTFDFIVPGEGSIIDNFKTASFNNKALIRSPYNEWKYWNGVLL